jgi:hypothetical protein
LYNFNSMWWNYCNTSQRIDWMFGNGYWGTCFTGSINHKREIDMTEKEIKKLWYECYNEDLEKDYEIFYQSLKESLKKEKENEQKR